MSLWSVATQKGQKAFLVLVQSTGFLKRTTEVVKYELIFHDTLQTLDDAVIK